MYESGENAPHTGIYLFMRHQYETHCQPEQDEKEMPIEEGEEFPGCPLCDDPGYWRYLRAKDKDQK